MPPECEAAARLPRIPLTLPAIAEARITDSTAVPIDAPAWRMMFIAVLVRAIAAAGTACIAAVMFGIIASPIPNPCTKFAEHSRTYGQWPPTHPTGIRPCATRGTHCADGPV